MLLYFQVCLWTSVTSPLFFLGSWTDYDALISESPDSPKLPGSLDSPESAGLPNSPDSQFLPDSVDSNLMNRESTQFTWSSF